MPKSNDNLLLGADLPEHSHPPHNVQNGVHGTGTITSEVESVGQALLVLNLNQTQVETIESYKQKLNSDDSAWDELRQETDKHVLASLLWDWIEHLKVSRRS